MAKGDHVFVPLCGLMTHHGIDVGDGTVIHWASGHAGAPSPDNLMIRKFAAEIRRTPMASFGDPARLEVRMYAKCDDSDTVVERAVSKIGEKGYCLFGNNCEHFATWCKTGEHGSEQVRDVSATAGGLGVGVRLATVAVPAVGLLGPGILMATAVAVPTAIALGIGFLAINLFQSDTTLAD